MRIYAKRSDLRPLHFGALLLILIIGCLIALLIPAASAVDGSTHNTNTAPALSKGNNAGSAGEVFDFPEDHILHKPEAIVDNIELFLEWLYWTGELRDANTGDLYGFQYTLFNQNLKPGLVGYVNHAAISDTRNSQHPRYRYAALPQQADITNGTDAKMGPYWRYEDNQTTLTYWVDLDTWNILTSGNVSSDGGHGQNLSLNLTIANENADYYIHRQNGLSDQGICLDVGSEPLAGKSYYYSHPSMTTKGSISLDGRNIDVQGSSWFDHQWGGFGKCYSAWDWFSLRLDDGSFVMLYNLKDPSLNDLPDQRGLSYIDRNGKIEWWYGEEAANLTANRWWESDLFGFRYPLDWTIDTPIGKLALQPYFDEQTMNVAPGEVKYWEGIIRVREGDLNGKQIGIGYMELAGYAPI
ncbi:MAG: Hydroxyneurosporene synthase (CrtC) [Methanosaeta sp. PtaU1.Bin112]|nr:MAG: Hydroxyneurosporene synthase (CrtC) [Methanosaeta sp. PtaU1.Bin112]